MGEPDVEAEPGKPGADRAPGSGLGIMGGHLEVGKDRVAIGGGGLEAGFLDAKELERREPQESFGGAGDPIRGACAESAVRGLDIHPGSRELCPIPADGRAPVLTMAQAHANPLGGNRLIQEALHGESDAEAACEPFALARGALRFLRPGEGVENLPNSRMATESASQGLDPMSRSLVRGVVFPDRESPRKSEGASRAHLDFAPPGE